MIQVSALKTLYLSSCLIVFLLWNITISAQNNSHTFDVGVLLDVPENPYISSLDSLYNAFQRASFTSEDDFKSARSIIYEMCDHAFFNDAENYLRLFLALAEEKGTPKDQALLYHAFGYNYKKKGSYEEAIHFYEKSIILRKEIGDKEGMSPTLSNLGNIYYDLGKYSQALEMYQESLSIRRELKDEKGIARTLSGIGNILSDQKRYDEALHNFREALTISKKIQDTAQIASLYTQIGGVKYVIKELDSSLNYYQLSLKYAETINYQYISGYAMANIGTVYLDKGDYFKAEEYLTKSLSLRQQLQSPLETTLSQLELARLYSHTERQDEAILLAKIAYKTSKEIQFLKGRQVSSEQLSQLNEFKENYKIALDYYKEYKSITDSLFTLEEKKIIDNIQTQIEIEKETYDLKLKQATQRSFYMMLLISLGILLAAIVIWFIYSRKLREKKTEIRIKQKELESEQKILFSTQKERKRISQDMHDDLGTSISGLRIFSEILMNKTPDDKSRKEHLKLLEMTNDVTQKVRDIVWTLDNKNDSIDNFIWYCHHYAENLFDNFDVKLLIPIEEDIPKWIIISGPTRKHFFLCVKESLNNVLKHSDANQVELSFSYRNDVFKIQIADNGKGFDVYQRNRFGNGIKNMENRMQSIPGNFQIDSNSVGTTVNLTVKIPQTGN